MSASRLLSSQGTLVTTVWPAARRWQSRLLLALIGSLALALSAKVQVPMLPVPITLQTLVLQMMAVLLGGSTAMAAVGAYLLEGAAGLAVFAGTPEQGIGIAYMAGPTGGYLAGFLLAAGLMGWLAELGWDRSVAKALGLGVLGNAMILICGALWLSHLIGPERAIAAGVVPFLWPSLVKIAAAAAFTAGLWSILGRRRPSV